MNAIQAGTVDRRHNKQPGNRVITVELEGQFYSTLDWSPEGFRIDGYEGALQPGKSAPVSIILEVGGETFEQAATASIVRIVGSTLDLRQLAAKFSNLGEAASDLLNGWQSGRLRPQTRNAAG